MNCKEKFLNLLTICRKAGKLVPGFDPAKEEILSHRASGVFVTADASARTKKEVRFFCDRENIPTWETELSMEDVQNALGRKAGVLAVCDKGFAKRLMELSDNIE
ncbi:MAG: 50S ribosomal protein L7 [Oscillospiraceae bacterium]|nr:50S ribosomal protein L7 [Oscillospiraceae bacterium]